MMADINQSEVEHLDEGENVDSLINQSHSMPSAVSKPRRWSKIYSYFADNSERKTWKCNHCSKEFAKSKDGGTGSLSNHLKNAHPDNYVDFKKSSCPDGAQHRYVLVEGPTKFAAFDNNVYRDKIVNFVVGTDQAFMLVGNPFFEDMMEYATQKEPEAAIPDRNVTKELISKKYADKKGELIQLLKNNSSTISFTLDTWTSTNQHSFMGVTAHFIDESFEFQNTVLDLVLLDGSHTGINLAHAFSEVLDKFDLWKKVLALTTDNASNMLTMCRHLDQMSTEKDTRFKSKESHVSCMAHVINLSCKAALKLIDEDGQIENYEEEEEEFDGIEDEDAEPELFTRTVVSKIRKAVKAIRQSHIFRNMMKRQCTANEIEFKNLVLDVRTRWNSTLAMLQRARELKIPLEFTLQKFKKLTKLALSDAEWKQVDDLIELLVPFKEATELMSTAAIPKLSDTVLIYNALFTHLEAYNQQNCSTAYRTNQPTNKVLPLWLKDAATAAWKKLTDYYPKTDGLVYSVATILDPRYKLKWYEIAGWKRDWIANSKRAITSIWAKFYKPNEEYNSSEEYEPPTKRSSIESQILEQLQSIQRGAMADELTKYLSEPIVSPKSVKTSEKFSGIAGILSWWKIHQEEYPNLSRMARDFLAVAGTSVPCERLFSSATDLITARRQNLDPFTITECLMLKHWLGKFPLKSVLEEVIDKALGEK